MTFLKKFKKLYKIGDCQLIKIQFENTVRIYQKVCDENWHSDFFYGKEWMGVIGLPEDSYLERFIQYLLAVFHSCSVYRSNIPPLDSMVFLEAILSSLQPSITFSSQRFWASMSPRRSISLAYHFPRSDGRIPYPICHPVSMSLGWSIWWRIWIAPRMCVESMRKKRVAGTHRWFSVRSLFAIWRNSSKLSPRKSALGLVGIFSKDFHSSIIAR